jgi:hypothetical protein
MPRRRQGIGEETMQRIGEESIQRIGELGWDIFISVT